MSGASVDRTLTERLKDLAGTLGFARCGVARVADLGRDAATLRHWVAEGYHGSMAWMADTADVRVDPADPRLLAGAASVLVVAAPYARPVEGTPDAARSGRIARYALGRDYHNVLGKRLRKVAALLRAEGHAARVSVDTMPVLERAWAQRAGVGFIGKNCCLIVPGLGSHVFLGAVLTTATLEADEPARERCGTCRLCLDACPTRAFVGPRLLDARRCIAYLTIEHRGPVPEALRPDLGEHLFGCDDCQDVCPFNGTRTAPDALTAPFKARPEVLDTPPEAYLGLGPGAFAERFRGSPLRRAGRDGMARNAALVLGNRGDRRHLRVLRDAAAKDRSSVVRDAARWAVERLDHDES
ncbi:MAG: tRNA epoxyqueuosine(34) reductase QueG [Sandaracinaceae bacterium]